MSAEMPRSNAATTVYINEADLLSAFETVVQTKL